MTTSKFNRKRQMGIFGIVLVFLLAIAVTLAFLQSHTDKATNTFTLGEGVDVVLKEQSVRQVFSPGCPYKSTTTVEVPTSTAMKVEYVAVQIDYYVEKEVQNNAEYDLSLEKIENTDFIASYAKMQSYDVHAETVVLDEKTNKAIGPRGGWVTDDYHTYYYGTKGSDGKIVLAPVTAGAVLTVFDELLVDDDYGNNHSYKERKENPKLNFNGVDLATRGEINLIKENQLETFHTVVSAYAVQGDINNEQAMGEFEFLFTHNTTSST